MRKIVILVAVMATLGVSYAQSGLNLGIRTGFPVGDVSEVTTFELGLDVAYLFEVSEIFDVGIASGYDILFGDDYESVYEDPITEQIVAFEIETDNLQYIPIAATFVLNITDSFYFGGDIGYAIGIGDSDGGFLYEPKLGFNQENWNVYGYFRGVVENSDQYDYSDVSTIGIGFNYAVFQP